MWWHILPFDQKHHQEELKNNLAIPKSHHGSYTRLKFPSGLIMVQRDYLINAQTVTRSKAHITGPNTNISQIPRDDIDEKGQDMQEEINRYTSTPKVSAQPSSSQAPARGLDCLDCLMARVGKMYDMLERHLKNTTGQFTYVEGQINALSSQIKIWLILASLAISVKKGE